MTFFGTGQKDGLGSEASLWTAMKYEPHWKRRYTPVWDTVFILSEFVALVQHRGLESLQCSLTGKRKRRRWGGGRERGRVIERHLGSTYSILVIIQVHLLWNTVDPWWQRLLGILHDGFHEGTYNSDWGYSKRSYWFVPSISFFLCSHSQ